VRNKVRSIQIWDCDRLTSRPRLSVFDTHNSAEIYSISFSTDGKYFSTRGADHTVNIWQNRSLSHPVISYTNLPSYHETANCAFCPHASLICIGTSVLPGQGSSSLQIFDFLDSESHSPILQFNVAENASLVRLLWHNKLNQLFCTLSNGSVRVYYDTEMSIKGALKSTSKIARKKNALETLLESRRVPNVRDVITPHALPIFQDTERMTKRKREKDLKDPIKTKRPDPATHSKIETGMIPSKGVNFSQFIAKTQGEKNRNIAGVDPREALFKYSEGKNYVTQAYAENKVILAEKTVEEEEDETKKRSATNDNS